MRTTRTIVATMVMLVVASCSASTSSDDYVADLQSTLEAADGRLDEVEGAFNAGLLAIDFEAPGANGELIELFQASMEAVTDTFVDLVDDLSRLTPPGELDEHHGDTVEAGRRVVLDYQARASELAEIATIADIDAYAQALAASPARADFVAACEQLRQVADSAGVDVELSCLATS